MASLSEDELAERAGSTPERVRRFAGNGILAPGPDGAYRAPDIQRVRIAEALEGAGVSSDQVAPLIADGRYSTGWADGLFPDPVPMSRTTLAAAVHELGLTEPLVARLFASWGLPLPGPADLLRDDDLELLRISAMAFHALQDDEEAMVAGARYFGENLRRIAESQVRFFRDYVEEPMIALGVPQHQVMDNASAIATPMMDAGYRAAFLLQRRHLEHYTVQDIVVNTEVTLERAGISPRRMTSPPAISFLDLTGYTSLTEERGDEHAADLALRLAELVQVVAGRHGGRAVKYLGDGVMFHFPDPVRSVPCGLELVEAAPAAGLPPAHVGINSGPVIFRDGDYFGRVVNIASRVADHAGPGEVLVTEDVAVAAKGVAEFVEIGPVVLKGLAEPVQLHRAARIST